MTKTVDPFSLTTLCGAWQEREGGRLKGADRDVRDAIKVNQEFRRREADNNWAERPRQHRG